jgi:TonB family protein
LFRVLLLFVCLLSLTFGLQAQSPESTDSGEVLQSKIQRARALIAAHQLETAARELESVRAATQDYAINNITSVMLMSIYLEAGNYARAEALLEESFRARAVRNGDSARTYFALAGQAVNGSRLHLARYRSFGISITDSNLPEEVVNDLDRLRSFLERMVAQAKEITMERKAYDSLSMLEDVVGIRMSLARDADDQSKWAAEHVQARQFLASQTQLASLNGISALPPGKYAIKQTSSPYSTRRVEDGPTETKTAVAAEAGAGALATGPKPASQTPAGEIEAGSLNAKATRKVVPSYPPIARQAGASGLVRVHVVVDETGKVVEVSRSEGHVLLRRVAEDAARQWFFEPSAAGAATARFSGYIDFNFTL